MEFLFDTANLETIEEYGALYPYTGVTSNPSILKKEGKVEFFSHFRALRDLIGPDRTLHIQVVGHTRDEIVADAEAILEKVDDQVYIKVPTTEQGIAAIGALTARGVHVTATAIYSKIQGFAAISAGADFLAPYVNRIANLDGDPVDVVRSLVQIIDGEGADTRILAASFKNIAQVNEIFLAGAQTVTIAPSLLRDAFGAAAIGKAVADFDADWASIHGNATIADLG